jgi:glyoxylase-like metal-dependent hydrolase (beta-lactamase superfamily II)
MVEKYITNQGRVIYRFPVQSFPELITYIHVIRDAQNLLLVDCGSGMDNSNEQLQAGLTAIEAEYGERVGWEMFTAVLITHGHLDHFGGLAYIRQFTSAPIGIHQLDVRVLSNYEERRIVAARQLEIYLEQAGVGAPMRENLMAMYLFAKDHYRSIPVQFLLDEDEPRYGLNFYHVPGHCPGQVCIQVDDIMLTADHILNRITPHQAPESITMNMGLGHYLDSLTKISRIPGIRLGLGGHEEPIPDVYGRIQEIKTAHQHRLDKILEICATPKTIAEVSQELFGRRHSYHILLAIEEAGAHVEYLYQRGALLAANVAEIAATPHPIIQYIRAS